MWKIFKPTWKKIIVTFILVCFTVFIGYLLMGVFVECLFNWGCDTVSFKSFIANAFSIVLILPVYYFFALLSPLIGKIEFFEKGHNWLFIFGFFEIIYIYFLACLILHGWKKYKKQKK